MEELQELRCIKEVDRQPYVCSPLSVVINDSGKKRLVINLPYLNRYLWKEKFKYEDLRTVMQMFSPNDYMFSFDLKSGYHHVDIYPEHWQYLGFAWGPPNHKRYYTFTVLPFALATACYVFTKLMRPLIRHWRGKGIRVVMYIDDGIVAVEGKEKAHEVSLMVQENIKNAGFITHIEKSRWDPTKTIVWLGFEINLEQGHIIIPQRKIDALQLQLRQATPQSFLPARNLASIIGKIIAMSLALGHIARFMTRSLYSALNAMNSWSQMVQITPEALTELQFWLYNIHKYNGQNIWHSPAAVRLVYSDASSTGYGGYTVQHGPQVAHGLWSEQEALQSFT